MTKYHKRHRIIATFFLLIFFPTLLPNNLFASNNGPNSFEAANFEPVDATDMVSLATGDLSYVLPLLNVPSPEGGYPLALSYHAGIAMDQEASWVGLGWSLNPGAINRNINGYPDDIETGSDNSFIYDQGGQLNYYSVGIGANFNGIKVGVGAYWGSNKTLGGSVALGYGPLYGSVTMGTAGTSFGVGVQYSGSVENLSSTFSNDVSFSSIRSLGNSMPSGTGLASGSTSTTNDGINIQSSYTGLSMGAYGFYFSYEHRKIKYSLFQEQIAAYCGILYSNINPDYKNPIKYDTNKLVIYDEGRTNIDNVLDLPKNYLCDNVVLPNYDNYKVQAQGLSGSISPTFTSETQLCHEATISDLFNVSNSNFGVQKGYYDSNISYPTLYNNADVDLKLNKKIFFDFENTNSSFLRVDRTKITTSSQVTTSFEPLLLSKTNKSQNFNETTTNDNIPLKNNQRKRAGKHIEVFTNQQIQSGSAKLMNGFIEASNLNRNQSEVYKPESIGGYQITDIDGKTYHYSLPVINYEIWYKNFSNQTNEDSKFLERELSMPYATDWLLTAVTGPDYVDKNDNGKVDKDDYGYWVEFDYGKWSDGYIWNSSSGKSNLVKGNATEADHYEYYSGRKQIYYLDAVKTRTHTAYFIKSARQDATADALAKYNVQSSSGVSTFNNTTNPKTFSSALTGLSLDNNLKYLNLPTLPSRQDWVLYLNGYQKVHTYMDFPVHYSLKLDKIVLVKNNTLTLDKARGNQQLADKGYLYKNRSFEITDPGFVKRDYSNRENVNYLKGTYYAKSDLTLKEIAINQNKNVLDAGDVSGLDIDSNAEKVIVFQSNYSSIPNSFHSLAPNKGKLTLNSVEFLGHNAVSHLPRYKFNYNNVSTAYNLNDQDQWGYNKNAPSTWSLSEIITPMGSSMKIDYESDDYGIIATSSSSYGKGGGIRVKQISTFESTNLVNRSNYYYNKIGTNKDVFNTNYRSSGVISYVPSDNLKIPYASELPPPIVMYSNVSIEQTAANNELVGRTDYVFETLPEYRDDLNSVYNLGKYFVVERAQNETFNYALPLNFTKYNIKNSLNNLGRLLSVKNYNSKDQIQYSLKNEYATPNDLQDELGTKQESYLSKSYKKEPDPSTANPNPNTGVVSYNAYFVNGHYVNSVSKIWYPNKLIKTTTTKGGFTSSTTYDKFDFLTGNVIESTTSTSDGQSFKNKIIPAYKKYAQMGAKVDNTANKNMLMQTAANYSYIFDKTDAAKPWKETGVGVTTWSNIWSYKDITGSKAEPAAEKEKIWRKHKSYVWNGSKDANGVFTNYIDTETNKDDGFNWNLPSGVGIDVTQPSQWKQLSEITLYNHYSAPLEFKGLNNNYITNKTGDFDSKTTTTGNGRYGEIFYSGAEINDGIWLDSEISISSQSMLSELFFHTGKKSVETTSTSKLTVSMKNGEHKLGKYKVSVWVQKNNASKAVLKVNNDVVNFLNDNITAGNWQLKTAIVQVPKTACTLELYSLDNSKVYFDDLMVRPVTSSMNGHVYNEWDELTYLINNNGLATKFEYDKGGRIIKTYSEVIDDANNGITGGFKLVKSNTYNNKFLAR